MLAHKFDQDFTQPAAHIHAIGTAVPDNDVHGAFVDWATARLATAREQRLFQRMEGRSEPQEVRFRFVLALILMRKRLLKYEGMETANANDEKQNSKSAEAPVPEVWQMKLRGREESITVINPHLTEEQIGEVSGQLSSILAEEV